MEHFVGIDVAKDRLDVHIRPGDEAFAVARNGKGLAMLSSPGTRSLPFRSRWRRPAPTGRWWPVRSAPRSRRWR